MFYLHTTRDSLHKNRPHTVVSIVFLDVCPWRQQASNVCAFLVAKMRGGSTLCAASVRQPGGFHGCALSFSSCHMVAFARQKQQWFFTLSATVIMRGVVILHYGVSLRVIVYSWWLFFLYLSCSQSKVLRWHHLWRNMRSKNLIVERVLNYEKLEWNRSWFFKVYRR